MTSSNEARGAVGWAVGLALTGLYVVLYFWPAGLARADRRSPTRCRRLLRDQPATLDNGGQWFLYTTRLHAGGGGDGRASALVRYRHSRYHVIRTLSVVFFQTVIAFALPFFLVAAASSPSCTSTTRGRSTTTCFSRGRWPSCGREGTARRRHADLGRRADRRRDAGADVLFWEAVVLLVGLRLRRARRDGRRPVPPPRRTRASMTAWKVERWLVHGVLAIDHGRRPSCSGSRPSPRSAGSTRSQGRSGSRTQYGLLIGSIFAGVVGVGFYPILGSRVWCRFGCPMAAVLGLQQRFFSRFRITTNGGQCISCGQCSAYCEMGIDVKWYAQRGQNVVRASVRRVRDLRDRVPARRAPKLENGRGHVGHEPGRPCRSTT